MTLKTPDIYEGSPAMMRLAMCQVETAQWDVEGNFTRTLAALDEAARGGAQLAITPECVIHGYGFDGVQDYAAKMAEVAEPLDGPKASAFRRKAAEHGMDVIVGFAELGEGGRIHNTAVFISGAGEIVHIYRKVHCRPFESAEHDGVFVPGDVFPVDIRNYGGADMAIGTMICFDREIPESVRALRAGGAQFIACPLATDTSRMDAPREGADNEMVTQCRAAENEVFIAVVNHAGRFNGGSFLVGPGGQLIHQMDEKPGVALLDVPVGAIPERFHADPLGWMGWGYRRPEVYAKYLR